MEPWQIVLSVKAYKDYIIKQLDVPEFDAEERIECLRKCEENLCGEYGKTWSCPPGFDVDPEELYRNSKYVLLVRRTFCLDVNDSEVVEATSLEMHRIIRLMVRDLISSNVDCVGFADGGCKYCGVCAYPDPCRFPEMLVRSISALGLDLGGYLNKHGIDFSFSDECITLHGLIFIRATD